MLDMPRKKKVSSTELLRQVFTIHGMTCRSCELLIERTMGKVHGVTEVRASMRQCEVQVFSDISKTEPTMTILSDALHGTHYSLHEHGTPETIESTAEPTGFSAWMELGGMVILLIALAVILKHFDVLALTAPTEGILSLSAIFVVGLTAAVSTCLAIVGGLLLSISAKWTETHQNASRAEKFMPLFLFNIGRLGGYFVLGGLVGLLGASLSLTPMMTGYMTIGIAMVMILLGLNILKIIPKQYCTIPLPRFLRRRIQHLSESRHPTMPIMLGASTFFLPCGFTQSMQLLALGSGSFLAGGAIMFVFALGTLPALLGISVISSLAEGRFARMFLKFSGALVFLLGIFNLESGLLLTGVDAQAWVNRLFTPAAQIEEGQDQNVTINERGQQVISMQVTDQGYSPVSFTIDPGRETWVYATAPANVFGCAAFLTAPTFNLSSEIKQGGNWLGPIKNPENDFVLTCSMGMFRANVRVRPS